MAADNKVQIEIVLDDGSVKRGFATIQKEAQATGKDVEQNLNKSLSLTPRNLTDIAAGFFLVQQAVQAVGRAINSALNFVLAGERVNALETQFNNLAQTAGLSGQQLRSSFEEAADGLVDTGDLIEIASVRIAQFGSNAQRLPELLSASRQVALATGRDIKDVFDQLSQGIANGNTRALKQLGVFTDLDTAAKAYANSLGISVNELTESQRQAVALDGVLRTVEERFGNVSQSIQPTTDAITRLRVQTNETFESLSRIASNLLGSTFQVIANNISSALRDFNLAVAAGQGGAEGTAARIEILRKEIELLQQVVANPFQTQNLLTGLGVRDADEAASRLQRLGRELDNLTALQGAFAEEQRRAQNAAQADLVIREQAEAQARKEIATQEARIKALDAYNAAAQSGAQANLQTQLAINAQIVNDQERLTERITLLQAQRKLISDQFLADQSAIQKQFSNEAGFTEEERARLIAQARSKEEMAIKQVNDEIKKSEQDKNNALLFGSIDTYKAIESATNNFVKTAGTALVTTLGASLVQGASAFSNFKNTVLNLVGDLLINIGQSIVFTGQAIDSLRASLTSLFGGFAVAGGLALIALGGALKASAGGALTASATSGGTSDLGVGATQEELTQTASADLERGPNTVINVAFEGDVIGDSADTGSRIVSLINDAFDKQGVVLRQQTV